MADAKYEKITNDRSGDNPITLGSMMLIEGHWYKCDCINEAEDFGDGKKRYDHLLHPLPILDSIEKLESESLLKAARTIIELKLKGKE